jgi:hypothetical protein
VRAGRRGSGSEASGSGHGSATAPAAGESPGPELLKALRGLREILEGVGHPRSEDIGAALLLADRDVAAFWRAIDGNAWWGGAGSLAAETLGDNPGIPQAGWEAAVRELRAGLIEVGETLMARTPHNPGISSWVLAFRNWSASQV